MEGRKLERLVKAPTTGAGNPFAHDSHRAGHAALPQWRCTPRPAVVDLPSDLGAVLSVHCGAEHTLALTEFGSALGFGRGDSGQLGRGNLNQGNETAAALRLMEDVPLLEIERQQGVAPKKRETVVHLLSACGDRSISVSKEDSFFSWGAGWKAKRKPKPKPGKQPRKVKEMTKLCITQLQLGDELGVALDMIGHVYTFGGAQHASMSRRRAPAEQGFATHHVVGFGPMGNTAVTCVACGASHCIAVTSEGQPYGWGSDISGQLGLGGPEAGNGSVVPVPMLISSFRGHVVEKVWCGGDASFALTSNAALFSWGSNLHGQLGQGHDRTSEPVRFSIDFRLTFD